MDNRKWLDRYSIDCRLKYPSLDTQKNYISNVGVFLNFFSNYREPKEVPTDKIKEWDSMTEASIGIIGSEKGVTSISSVCSGKQLTYKGFIF